MKLSKYLMDNLYKCLIFMNCFIINFLIFIAFKVNKEVIISTTIVYGVCFVLILFIPYWRKKKFYTDLLLNIEALDKGYLVLETLTRPGFYEGELLCESLYDINKSMNENVRIIREHFQDFKEYIEMWIHEVKVPLATLNLLNNNCQGQVDKRIKTQLRRIEDYVDQVLYYARSENAEKDYLIKEVNLAKIIKNVGLKNMDDLLENKIDFRVENVNVNVLTDAKWLEFILGEIVNNSIKYKRNIKNAYIKIMTIREKDRISLVIEDNGIGIKKADLKQVFDKSFTGENGRNISRSTGMGLFIAKNMCSKLGHKISIEACENKYTKVFITFAVNKYYDVVK